MRYVSILIALVIVLGVTVDSGFGMGSFQSHAASSNSSSKVKLVILRFDDSYQSQWVNALPVLEKYDFNATFLAITAAIQNGSIPSGVVTYPFEYMNWQEFEYLYNHGYEIADHSSTHPYMTSLSESQLKYQVDYSKHVLDAHDLTDVPAFALPYGAGFNNLTVVNYILNAGFDHVYAAWGSPAINNYYKLNSIWYPVDEADNDTSLSSFEVLANQASSSAVVGFVFHMVENNVTSYSPYNINVTEFERDMAFLNSSGFTTVVPSGLPGYYSSVTTPTTTTRTTSPTTSKSTITTNSTTPSSTSTSGFISLSTVTSASPSSSSTPVSSSANQSTSTSTNDAVSTPNATVTTTSPSQKSSTSTYVNGYSTPTSSSSTSAFHWISLNVSATTASGSTLPDVVVSFFSQQTVFFPALAASMVAAYGSLRLIKWEKQGKKATANDNGPHGQKIIHRIKNAIASIMDEVLARSRSF